MTLHVGKQEAGEKDADAPEGRPEALNDTPRGVPDLRVAVTVEGGDVLEAELLLVAVGRGPSTDGLGYEEQGVATSTDTVFGVDLWLAASGHTGQGPVSLAA